MATAVIGASRVKPFDSITADARERCGTNLERLRKHVHGTRRGRSDLGLKSGKKPRITGVETTRAGTIRSAIHRNAQLGNKRGEEDVKSAWRDTKIAREGARSPRGRKGNLRFDGASHSLEKRRTGGATQLAQKPIPIRAVMAQHRRGNAAFNRDSTRRAGSMGSQLPLERFSEVRASTTQRIGAGASSTLAATARGRGAVVGQSRKPRVQGRIRASQCGTTHAELIRNERNPTRTGTSKILAHRGRVACMAGLAFAIAQIDEHARVVRIQVRHERALDAEGAGNPFERRTLRQLKRCMESRTDALRQIKPASGER